MECIRSVSLGFVMQKSDTDLELENNAHNENRLRLAALGFFERERIVFNVLAKLCRNENRFNMFSVSV